LPVILGEKDARLSSMNATIREYDFSLRSLFRSQRDNASIPSGVGADGHYIVVY